MEGFLRLCGSEILILFLAPGDRRSLIRMKTILIIGATSAIAEETAKLYATRGYRLVLWGRRMDRLASIARNLQVLGASDVQSFEIDLDRCDDHAGVFRKTIAKVDSIDVALLAHGVLPARDAAPWPRGSRAGPVLARAIGRATPRTPARRRRARGA